MGTIYKIDGPVCLTLTESALLKFRTHGKWILAGEHSVLRGNSALVFPVESRHLDFSFEPGDSGLELVIDEEFAELERAFWKVLDKALGMLDLKRSDMNGKIALSSDIPVGAGMGASATLCVSLARWLSGLGHLGGDQQYGFAKELENVFHGESSGVDVAVALNNQAMEFRRPNVMKSFFPTWQPHFFLSYSGVQGVTSECIEKVQRLFASDRSFAESIDLKMQRAVDLAKKGLTDITSQKSLVDAIALAGECFNDWDLVGPELQSHMSWLKSHGATAVKPTGSGYGGFVLSLWDSPELPDGVSSKLIRA